MSSIVSAYENLQKSKRQNFDPEKHIRFVKRIANTFKEKIPQSLCIDDLVQVGLIALIDVNEKYDETIGKTFENFASRRVKGAMIDLIRENTPLSKEKISLAKQAAHYVDDYILIHGRKPKESFVAEHLSISLEKYQSLLLECESIFNVDITEISVFDSGLFSNEDMIDEERTKKRLIDALKLLNDKEQKIISLYFIEELTHAEIGEVMSITESRVSQIIKSVLIKLKASMQLSFEGLIVNNGIQEC